MSERIGDLAEFRLITRGDQLPVFAFTTSDKVTAWDVFAVSRRLRERGWQVPAYTFPEQGEDLAMLRVVCRNGSRWTWRICSSRICSPRSTT